MEQAERRQMLLTMLLREEPLYANRPVPDTAQEQKQWLRALMNVRPPRSMSRDFLHIQDAYLQAEIAQKGITKISDLQSIQPGIYLWQGDITTLACDAIVNAANSEMLGCFCPCHGCIDNAIHTYAGVELRLECAGMMQEQGHAEPLGSAKITKAYNLPCRYIIHTVGPIVDGSVTETDEECLASCYRSCLTLADENRLQSIAFCCIATGEYHFPNRRAAEIAVRTVKNYKAQTQSQIEVIFNVFKDSDYAIYRELLG